MSNELKFDISLQEKEVTIGGDKYILREANGAAAVAFRNASLEGVTFNDGKLQKLQGQASLEPLLVSMCLFFVGEDGTVARSHVNKRTIETWPSGVMKELFEIVKEMSDLSEGEDSVESLQEQIDKLEEKKQKLEKDELGNS